MGSNRLRLRAGDPTCNKATVLQTCDAAHADREACWRAAGNPLPIKILLSDWSAYFLGRMIFREFFPSMIMTVIMHGRHGGRAAKWALSTDRSSLRQANGMLELKRGKPRRPTMRHYSATIQYATQG